MFALDVSREVEGYVAEASIRSRHLKTEAGDIPGGGEGEDVRQRAQARRKVESILRPKPKAQQLTTGGRAGI